MRIAIYGLMLTLAGCATAPPAPPQPTNWDYINAGLQRYRGHDVRELAAVIGYPDSQRVVMGDTVYLWRSDVNMPVPNYNMQMTTGMVGSTPYYQNTTDTQPSYVHLQCSIEVVADANGALSTYHLDGQNGACWKYARALAAR
jgi:hypothetical protein